MLTHAPVAAFEVAACIARHAAGSGQATGLDAQKIHNLLFLCQVYSLAARGVPLFEEPLAACPGGASCPAATDPREDTHAAAAPRDVAEVVSRVWETYGCLSARQLRRRVNRYLTCDPEHSGAGADRSGSCEVTEKACSTGFVHGIS